MIRAHSTSRMFPSVWTNKTDNLFADGIGRRGGSKVIIMESSGPYAEEDVDHPVGDTMKFIKMATSSLRSEILKYPNASIETAKGLAVFGVQCIRDKITLTKYSLHNSRKWEALELRSAAIPVTWNSRYSLMHVFELLATLQNEYQAQNATLQQLFKENSFRRVKGEDTIKYHLKYPSLLSL